MVERPRWSRSKWKFNISSASLLFNPSAYPYNHPSAKPLPPPPCRDARSFTLFSSGTVHFYRDEYHMHGCVQYPRTRYCAEVTLRFIEKPPSLSRMGRAATEIAGEFFVNSWPGRNTAQHSGENFLRDTRAGQMNGATRGVYVD